jgi:amidase
VGGQGHGPGDAGLVGQARALAAGDVTSRELVASCLERIARTDPVLGAFRCVRGDAALQEAAAADDALAAGDRRPLLGVPVAVKDDVDIAGETTPFGTGGTHPVATADAELVRRLRAAGAVVVGKTCSPELGQWPFTEGPGFGATRNPYDLERTPGGSSGGSAAAVAAGLVPAAVGSDGAGSVRIPAAWTGLVGIKGTRDLVPTLPAVRPFHGLTCHGPLARTVQDAALLLDVLAGAGGRLQAAAGAEPGRLRIGVSLAAPWFVPGRVDPRVQAAVERLAGVLAGLGHAVDPVHPRHEAAGVLFLPRGTNGVRRALAQLGPGAEVEPRTREHARLGGLLGGPVLAAAQVLEPALAARMRRTFERVDVLLMPTTARTALRVGELDGRGLWATGTAAEAACPFAFPWNVVGWPGINVPAGTDEGGVPVGAQLLGTAGTEPRLLALAAQLQDAERWHERRPPVLAAA